MDKNFINRIEERRIKLENARQKLKEKFIGIDDVIDRIIESITLWYLAPEFQFRPQIVCLWGTTGVGKTDLVRTLVKLLNFRDKFIEISMDDKDYYIKTIQKKLELTNINPKDPQVLLLDEFQRYETIDEKDKLLEMEYFNDVWMLLSDGKFGSNAKYKNELYEMIIQDEYYQERREECDEKEDLPLNSKNKKKGVPKRIKIKKYKTGWWEADRLKKILKCDIDIKEMMMMGSEEKIEMINKYYESDEMCEGDSYEKMLIFISGNLDEAYKMANDVEDNDTDADIYHEYSKKINLVHIKSCLRRKFKPEQIARFGNNHIIYPCLSKATFYEILRMRCNKLLDKIYEDHQIKIMLDQNVYDVIYSNGVFPTQGVRPLLSTVSQILDNNVPYFIYTAFEENINELKINCVGDELISNINGREFRKKICLDIDNIKNKKSDNEKKLVLVHEMGHAMIYSLLFEASPSQINLNSTSFGSGFMNNLPNVYNNEYIRNSICVDLAGMVAEEYVFDTKYRTAGCMGDIKSATTMAAVYVRNVAMDSSISKINKNAEPAEEVNYDTDSSNPKIEAILEIEKKRAHDLIINNTKLYKDLLKYGWNLASIDLNHYAEIFKKHKINIRVCELSEVISYGYADKLKEFLE